MEDNLREEFLNKVRGQIKHWANKEISIDSKFDGLAESFLGIIDSGYQMAPIGDDGVVLPTISGRLKSKYLGNDKSVDAMRDEFVENLEELKNYWKGQDFGSEDERKLSGFIFSTLVSMDGGTGLPPYFLASNEEPDTDLAGYLHELLYQESEEE